MALKLSDYLALSRTELANERTFLAYFRTFVVMLSSGIAIIKIKEFAVIYDLGIALCFIAPIIFLIGLFRYFYTKRKIKRLGEKYHIPKEDLR